MRWQSALTGVVLLLGALVLAPWVIGHFLPADSAATESREFDASPALVWAVLADPSARPAWLKNVRRVESREPNAAGLPRWLEVRRDGTQLVMEQTTRQAMRSESFHTVSAPDGYAEHWRYSLETAAGGTRVIVHVRVHWQSPYLRTLNHFLHGSRAAVVRVLDNLGQALEGDTVTEVPGR